jgi:LysM repeat protein
MSAATEFPPVVRIPARARRTSYTHASGPGSVATLPRPSGVDAPVDRAEPGLVALLRPPVPGVIDRPSAFRAPTAKPVVARPASRPADQSGAATGASTSSGVRLLVGGRGLSTDLVEPGIASPRRASVSFPVAEPIVIEQPDRLGSAVAGRAAERSVRLTVRGWVVLGALAVAVAAAFLLIAHLSASSAGSVGGASRPAVAASAVTVRSGDTLWSIAARVAPDRDPRAVVDDLQRLNHLTDAGLVPGEVLRVR